MGTVTEVAPDHFTDQDRCRRSLHHPLQREYPHHERRRRRPAPWPGQTTISLPPTRPQAIKASDIKVGDAIGASGEIDANAKSVGAVVIFQIDPERAKQMREMQANYGKTWIMGKVTAINELR